MSMIRMGTRQRRRRRRQPMPGLGKNSRSQIRPSPFENFYQYVESERAMHSSIHSWRTHICKPLTVTTKRSFSFSADAQTFFIFATYFLPYSLASCNFFFSFISQLSNFASCLSLLLFSGNNLFSCSAFAPRPRF